MNLVTIAWKSIRQRWLASTLTAFSVALGVMLMVSVLVIFGIIDQAFSQRSIGYHLIVGPKGSDLQLVLSSIYRVQPPIENLPFLYYRQLLGDEEWGFEKDPRILEAVPLAFGDYTQEGGFPIVGTTGDYFRIDYAPKRKFRIRGRRPNGPFDAIIGSHVARRNGWTIGPRTIEVRREDFLIPIAKWMQRKFPGTTESDVETWVHAGTLRVNGKRTSTVAKLRERDEISVPDDAYPKSATDAQRVRSFVIEPDDFQSAAKESISLTDWFKARFKQVRLKQLEEWVAEGKILIDGSPAKIDDSVRVGQSVQQPLGSQFQLVHGSAQADHVHDEMFTVVAVLEQTGTANDKTVFLDLEGFYTIEGHDKPIDEVRKRLNDFYANDPRILTRINGELDELAAEKAAAGGGHVHHHGGAPDVMKEVTSVLLLMRDGGFDTITFENELKKGYQAMAVNPIRPMQRLMNDVVGNIRKVLVVLTGLIIVVSGVGIFVSIYNSMSDRKREIAIMRALGARRQTVFSIILAESVLLCLVGGAVGLLLGHGLVFAAAPTVAAETGLLIDPFAFEPLELTLFPILFVLASLVGFLPATTAYRTDVADALG